MTRQVDSYQVSVERFNQVGSYQVEGSAIVHPSMRTQDFFCWFRIPVRFAGDDETRNINLNVWHVNYILRYWSFALRVTFWSDVVEPKMIEHESSSGIDLIANLLEKTTILNLFRWFSRKSLFFEASIANPESTSSIEMPSPSCALNGTWCPPPNWAPVWNLTMSTICQPSSADYFLPAPDKPWGLISLVWSVASNIWKK